MKTALCLSGHLRTFKHTFASLKKYIIDPFNCDVFIHTWDVIAAPPNGKTPGDAHHRAQHTLDQLQDIYTMYDPKMMDIGDEKDKIAELIHTSSDIIIRSDEQQYIMNHIGYHLGMFYSVRVANDLRKEYQEENSINYDCIIRCRPDLFFNHHFSIPTLSSQTVYVPEIGTYVEGGMNDQVAIAHPDAMDKYCEIYPNITDYYRYRACCPRPELLLKHHLNINGISVQNMDIKYDIYRLEGTVLRQFKMHAEWVPGANFYR